GFSADDNTVTVFAGEGPRVIVDQLARDPNHLANTFAACLRTAHHPKLVIGFDCVLVVGPEHGHVFAEAGWDRVRGAADMAEGVPDWLAGETLGKFRPDGLLLAYAGGGAGLFSAMMGGWA